MKKYHFENFLMIIKSAGFIAAGMIGSKNALNFAYALTFASELTTPSRREIANESFGAGS